MARELSDLDSDMTATRRDRQLQGPKTLGGDSDVRPFQGTATPVSHDQTVKKCGFKRREFF